MGSNSTAAVGPKLGPPGTFQALAPPNSRTATGSFSSAEVLPTNNVAAMMPQTIPRYLANIRLPLREPPPNHKGDCITSAQILSYGVADHCCTPSPVSFDRYRANPTYRRA